jgi:transcriptional/translational regulatory protein YebC/TACO1
MAGHSKWSKVKHIKGPLDPLIIEAATDNKNRTAADLRLIFSKYAHAAAQVLRLIQDLEDSDDAPNAQSNFHAPEELFAKAG